VPIVPPSQADHDEAEAALIAAARRNLRESRQMASAPEMGP
jgi:hypothetical protein